MKFTVERGVEGVVGAAALFNARDAKARRLVAGVDDDAGERLCCTDRLNELRGEQGKLLRDQEGIAAAAHIKHTLCREEAGPKAVVLTQYLQREPDGHNLGDGGRDERRVGVLSNEFVAIGVHHQHQARRQAP